MTEIHLYICDIGRLDKRRLYGKEILRRFPGDKICEFNIIIQSGIEKNFLFNKYRGNNIHRQIVIKVRLL